MNPRFDIYGPVHRGLRHAMQAAVLRLGRLDAADAQDVHETVQQLGELLDWLDEHLHIEERFLHRAIEQRRAGALPASVHDDHQGHLVALAALRADLAGLAGAGADGAARAQRLYLALSRFVGENLVHMAFEEETMNPLLWALFDDAALHGIYTAILASEGPAQLGRAARWMVPAMAPQERAVVLAGARGSIDPGTFEELLAMIRGLIPPRDWLKLQAALGAA